MRRLKRKCEVKEGEFVQEGYEKNEDEECQEDGEVNFVVCERVVEKNVEVV